MTGAKADERQTLLGIVDTDATLLADHPGQTVIADKNYFGRRFEAARPTPGWTCCARPAKARPPPGNWVRVRIVQHVLARTATIWHHDRTDQPVKRSLMAYDHSRERDHSAGRARCGR